ncbi:putative membrane protein [Microvirga lupini]|uniref:Putative membrane protein n=1 Tax=Microvirga lupini TaxID=420324 RepID=A0A7W4VQU6_9HYPH|nr:putative membrane protein [Microvirga lupini]
MLGFTNLDYAALAFFLIAWFGYHAALELTPAGQRSLNKVMNQYRYRWMEQMVVRENRIVDTTILASLMNGTAFFASTSLIAIGGVLALLRSTDAVLPLFADLPFGEPPTRIAWDVKVVGLAVIFVYAFFKFAWSYRLFNYMAIIVGAVPVLKEGSHKEALAVARQAGTMNAVAGKHFNRGQRAFFFSLAYLGWFVSAYLFMAATAGVLIVMWRRQFLSDAREAALRQFNV